MEADDTQNELFIKHDNTYIHIYINTYTHVSTQSYMHTEHMHENVQMECILEAEESCGVKWTGPVS